MHSPYNQASPPWRYTIPLPLALHNMKILISGKPRSGQSEVIKVLTKNEIDPQESVAGYVTEHEFNAKYFKATAGVWADEFDNAAEWADEFSSEEAGEVRDALTLFIYTIGSPSSDHKPLSGFVSALDKPGASLAIVRPGVELSKPELEELDRIGFDVVNLDELEPIVHTALFDALDGDSEAGSDDNDDDDNANDHPKAPRELDEIMEELTRARESKTMTDESKRALAEKLADELLY